MHRTPTTLAVAAAAAALLLSGCGTTETTPSAAAEQGSQPVTVTDSRGTTVTLDRPATRVVGLEWAEVEMLGTLGVSPVGVADPKGYATWDSAAPLDDDVQDVGGRGEPSVDSIIALQPDLVVMEADRGTALIRQVQEYVPVIVTSGSDASRNLDRMREDFTMIAQAVGRSDKAEQVLADLDEKIAEGRERIEAAGATGSAFAMADGWMEGSNVSIRMFGKGALFSDVAEKLGLENAWTGKVDPVWGLGTTDVEGVTALEDNKDLRFLYSASAEPDVFTQGLANNPIWESLPFVKRDNMTKLDKGTWTFGGPAACEKFIDQLLEVYAA
jgi:ferric hydroxamate transport system substrate-binding protein